MHNQIFHDTTHTVVLLSNGVFAVDNENGTYTIYEPNNKPYTKTATLIDLMED